MKIDTINIDSKRTSVKKVLEAYGFKINKQQVKSDEYKSDTGETIYFFWSHKTGISIAINPFLPFKKLIDIPGVQYSIKGKHVSGIRFGSSMEAFPSEYQEHKPEDEQSRVGRLFVVDPSSFTEFLSRLISISSEKETGIVLNKKEEFIGLEIQQMDEISIRNTSDNNEDPLEPNETQGYESDPEIRKAVELYAESVAISYYESMKFRVQKLGKPFDLLCQNESELIHVEVKGSRSKLKSVFLTINEVMDAENSTWRSDLFVVDQIIVERNAGGLQARAGVARTIHKWIPAREKLTAITFKYELAEEKEWIFLG